MEKRLTVDVPEELYKALLKIQFERSQTEPKRVSLSEIIKEALAVWVEKK